MKRLPALPFLIILCLIAPFLFAQKGGGGGGGGGAANPSTAGQAASPTPSVIPMWICNMPAGAYIVALRSIVSISTQQYLIDGHTQVTELDIDTTGCALARFYYLEPNTPTTAPLIGSAVGTAQQLLQQGADATNQDVWQKVVKNYPTTTHAKTIEYRVSDKSTLTAIQTSLQTAWQNNRNTTFSPPASN
jgi:hypothetical protein